MEGSFGRHKRSPAALKAELEAERRGIPFLVWHEPSGEQRLLELEPGRLTVGRDLGCDVCLGEDEEVSRLHAELERVGSHWVLADHGLSRNGTFVNGERLLGERPLRDGDVLRFGTTQLRYRSPADASGRSTRPASGTPAAETLTPTQQRVLLALCRPYRDGSP